MAETHIRQERARDSVARLLALGALFVAAMALVWAVRAERKVADVVRDDGTSLTSGAQ